MAFACEDRLEQRTILKATDLPEGEKACLIIIINPIADDAAKFLILYLFTFVIR